jgi:hypothetical protein
MSRWRAVAGQAGWGLADQGLSSFTNFLLGLSVARTGGPGDLGAFSLAFATYTMLLNASQGMGTEPLVVRFSASADDAAWRRHVSSALGVPIALGLLAGAGALLVAAVAGGALRSAFLALALTLPGLLLQDAWRAAFFARRRAVLAFVNDLVWAVALVCGLALLHVTHHTTIFWVTATWGLAAGLGALVGIAQARVAPRPGRARRWLVEQRDLAPRYLGELTVGAASEPLSFYAIGAVAGLAVVGAIRGAQILLGPLYVFIIGFRLAALPEAVRLARVSTRRLIRLTFVFAGSIAVVAVIGDMTLFLLPEGVGRLVLGPTWPAARSVLLPVTIAMVGGGVMGAAVIGMRALAAARLSLRAKVIGTPIIVASALVAAALGGAADAAWGMAAGYAIGVVICWLHFRTALRARVPVATPAPPAAALTAIELDDLAEGGRP